MNNNLSLSLDLYELTMADCYLRYKSRSWATFDLFVRQLPLNRSFLISAGLEDALEYISTLKFSRQDLDYLRKKNIFSDSLLKYLANFRFRGDIWALPEGTVFFPEEPILRVTAPIIEAQIIESFLLNTINLQTMIASKAARVTLAAGGRGLYDFSLRRTHGPQAGMKVARCAYLAGFDGTSNLLAGKTYAIPIAGTMAHSFVMAFAKELDSFLAYANIFPARSILLVDTYNSNKGIENALKTGLGLAAKKYRLLGIRLDSGDIVRLSRFARRKFDRAGLTYVKIFASGNLDEFKIRKLLKAGACVDNFGVGTNMGTSIDAPCLDVIYKISEVTDAGGKFLPTMKLSQGKATYPGRKQIFRISDRRGRLVRDVLGLDKEKIKGRRLLIKVVDKGRMTYALPPLKKIRAFTKNNLACLPERLKDISLKAGYPVVVSPGLKKLRKDLFRQLAKRQ